MQCAACRAVYSNGLEVCPRCKRPATNASSPAPASEKTNATDRKAASRKAARTAPAAPAAQASEASSTRAASASETTAVAAATPAPPTSPAASTLIEFPGTARNRPQWRKDLSERVREIQARRAREAAIESASSPRAERAPLPTGEATAHATPAEAQAAPQLGLVPPAETPEMNPIVAAALRRIERARQTTTSPPVSRSSGRGGAATAVARVVEEQYETQAEPALESATATTRADSQAHASGLVVISAAPNVKAEATMEASVAQDASPKSSAAAVAEVEPAAAQTKAAAPSGDASAQTTQEVLTSEPAVEEKRAVDSPEHAPRETKPQPRRVANPVIDDSTLTRLEAEILPPVVSARDAFDDRAPLASRFVAAFLDLLVVAFLASPCAAVIELTSGNWTDLRVAGTMSAIFLLVMFLYQTGATALAGRTPGMKLLSLHTVDAESALSPTTAQSVRRSLVYMLSLLTFGLGLIYALFDAEGRAAHDHLSGTVVVHE